MFKKILYGIIALILISSIVALFVFSEAFDEIEHTSQDRADYINDALKKSEIIK